MFGVRNVQSTSRGFWPVCQLSLHLRSGKQISRTSLGECSRHGLLLPVLATSALASGHGFVCSTVSCIVTPTNNISLRRLAFVPWPPYIPSCSLAADCMADLTDKQDTRVALESVISILSTSPSAPLPPSRRRRCCLPRRRPRSRCASGTLSSSREGRRLSFAEEE